MYDGQMDSTRRSSWPIYEMGSMPDILDPITFKKIWTSNNMFIFLKASDDEVFTLKLIRLK